jgi:hypothetical protein
MAKPHLTDIQKFALVDKWSTSSLSLQDFCQQENISTSAFNRWQNQFNPSSSSPSEKNNADWINITPSESALLEAQAESAKNWNVELALPGNITLRLRY